MAILYCADDVNINPVKCFSAKDGKFSALLLEVLLDSRPQFIQSRVNPDRYFVVAENRFDVPCVNNSIASRVIARDMQVQRVIAKGLMIHLHREELAWDAQWLIEEEGLTHKDQKVRKM